ncbi:hypothetical protein Tco_1094353 [Tanacetum coccineum]|uniref:Uncharacterized protein n=1 Tax=Tanacetum coccineum TaxID=301880 RepID=A0ABQ5IGI9_9ASTR
MLVVRVQCLHVITKHIHILYHDSAIDGAFGLLDFARGEGYRGKLTVVERVERSLSGTWEVDYGNEKLGMRGFRRIEEEVDPDFLSDAHSRTGPAESGDSCESKVYTSLRKSRVAFEDKLWSLLEKEKCHVKPNKVKEESEEEAFRKLRREKVIAYTTRQLEIHVKNDTTHVMDLGVMVETSKAENASTEMLHGFGTTMEKKDGCVDETVARHGVHVSSIPDKDGMYIEVLKRCKKVVRNTSRYGVLNATIDDGQSERTF